MTILTQQQLYPLSSKMDRANSLRPQNRTPQPQPQRGWSYYLMVVNEGVEAISPDYMPIGCRGAIAVHVEPSRTRGG